MMLLVLRHLLPLFLCFIVMANLSSEPVEGVGLAAGKGESSKQEALSRAMRNAVEKSVGVMVSSETIVKNFQLLEDRIYSKVDGYVKSYDIIEDNKGVDDLYRIKIRAEVEAVNLENDLKGIKIILDAKGNPRAMVLLAESIDGQEISIVAADIEGFLRSKSFPMIDSIQLAEIKKIDSEDPEKAKNLGKRFGAELIIGGQASAITGAEREAYGVPVYSSNGQLTVKAIHADTGAILAVLSQSATGHAGNPGEAGTKALKDCWQAGKDAFFKDIMEKLQAEVLNDTQIDIIITGLSPEIRPLIKEKISSAEGVKKFSEKSFSEGVLEAVLNVEAVSAANIDEKISKSAAELILTSKSANRIDFKYKSEAEEMKAEKVMQTTNTQDN